MSEELAFDEFTIDRTRGGIWRDNSYVPLRPKTLCLLLFLAENAGRLVSKDEIVEAVWQGVVVTDESIAKCVSELRAALGTAGHRVLKTAPKRGYIFQGRALPTEAADSCARITDTAGVFGIPIRSKALKAWGAVVIPIIIFLVGLIQFAPKTLQSIEPVEAPSIAVLPFAEIDAEAHRSYFGDGLAEDLSVGLGKFSELFVIASQSSSRFAPDDSPQTVGRELGARYVVKGSIRRTDDRLRITAELIDAASSRQLWAEQYDRAGADLFALQDELAEKIVTTLVAYVSRSELDRVSKKPVANLDAYDLYLKGTATLRARNGPRRGEMVMAARRLFDQSLKRDPSYAPALNGLAYTYAIGFLERTDYDPLAKEVGRAEILGHALSLARRSLQADPYRAESHATTAWILHWFYRRKEALDEFERALELNPKLADGRFTHMLVHDGRAQDGIAYMQRIMKHDPFPPPIYLSYLGNAYYETGQYDAAYHTLKGGYDAIPGYRPLAVWLAASLAQLSRREEAKPLVDGILKETPSFTTEAWLEHIQFANQADAERLASGMKMAGFPE